MGVEVGVRVRVRPLGTDERELVAGFFDGLSAESRRRRFLQTMPRMPEGLVRRLAAVDGRRHVALVAEVDGETAGIARFVVLPGQSDLAEVAVTVADRFQGRGIGGVLLDVLATAAVRAGVETLVYLVDPTNHPMLRLLRHRDLELRFRDGLVEGTQPLPGARATPAA